MAELQKTITNIYYKTFRKTFRRKPVSDDGKELNEEAKGAEETKTEWQIVKVQVPLSGGSKRDCLVYAEGHEHMIQQPLPEAAEKALAGAPKGYFFGRWTPRGWEIGDKTSDQDW